MAECSDGRQYPTFVNASAKCLRDLINKAASEALIVWLLAYIFNINNYMNEKKEYLEFIEDNKKYNEKLEQYLT